MATGECKACDYSPVAVDARHCPRCGAANPNPGVANRYAGRAVLFGAAAGVLAGAGLGYCSAKPGEEVAGLVGMGMLGAVPGLCAGLLAILVMSVATWFNGGPRRRVGASPAATPTPGSTRRSRSSRPSQSHLSRS